MNSFALGKHLVERPLVLAPMVGVSDLPFREICLQQGATFTVAEMVTANTRLWDSEKNRLRLKRSSSCGPDIVQIAGFDPDMMAAAAQANVAMGAEVIDINMGCPAKKVLKKAAGSALLKDPQLVQRILNAVVAAVDVPVTLKIRTGWSRDQRNGLDIATIAEDCGIAMLSVHGRTRECRFLGDAEYDTIAEIKQRVGIPVIANGDINSPQKARFVLDHTRADGLMIGRAAQGSPWIFRQVREYLDTGEYSATPPAADICHLMIDHIRALHAFYGEIRGALFARKHIDWYSKVLPQGDELKHKFMQVSAAAAQLDVLHAFQDSGATALQSDLNYSQFPDQQQRGTQTAQAYL